MYIYMYIYIYMLSICTCHVLSPNLQLLIIICIDYADNLSLILPCYRMKNLYPVTEWT